MRKILQEAFCLRVGRISKYHQPEESSNIRVDTGVYEGDEISMFYDPMIAKVCSYGESRDEAIEHMQKALSQYAIEGVSHNINFLEDVIHSERFASGDLSTNYIAEEYPDGYEVGDILQIVCCQFFVRQQLLGQELLKGFLRLQVSLKMLKKKLTRDGQFV